MNCPRCGAKMTNVVCSECGFHITRIMLDIKIERNLVWIKY